VRKSRIYGGRQHIVNTHVAYPDGDVDRASLPQTDPPLPPHWRPTRLKHIARLQYGDSLPDGVRTDGPVAVYGSNGVVGSHSDANMQAPAIVIGRKGSFGKLTWASAPGFAIDTAFYADATCTSADVRWLFYALSTLELDRASEDTAVPGLSRETAHARLVGLPPLDEQRRIADFLDRKTEAIDALIAKKERLIALLEEKRTALITHAVTKGLNPDAPMKPSGIEWVGDVPAHWATLPLKRLARLESGHTPSRNVPAYWENCTIPWVTLSDVWQIRDDRCLYVDSTKEHVSELGLANSSARLLPADTVILSRTASVGFSAILAEPMATTQDYVCWICGDRLLPTYLLFVLRAMRPELRRLTMGSTHQTIYMPDVAAFSSPSPPVDEQRAIVAYVLEATQQVHAAEESLVKSILMLSEYRAAVITAAVTGRLDVSEAAS
jgi:type I restriction enzyme, S subunit